MAETEEFKFPDEMVVEAPAKGKPEEEKLEIEVVDDTPVEDKGRVPLAKPVDEVTDEELSSYDEKVQKRIKKFTKGYHDERRAKEEALREREAAESFARQLYEQNKKLQQQLATGSKAYIEQSKSAAQTALSAAEDKYKKAYESADTDALVAAQKEIARATLELDKASRMRPVAVKQEEEFTPPPKETTSAAPQLNERTKAWVAENSDWFGKDEEMTSAAMGLDRKLQREYGADYIGTEEYFKVIDRTMRKRFPEHFEDIGSHEEKEEPLRKTSKPVDEDEQPRRARASAVVAPATRSTAPKKITLTQSQVNIARRLGVPLELYAKKVAEQMRNENG